ncbi:hypothetical protein AWH49_04680 [Domibacillus aminovorans]|uniref:Capsule biosynthesis protein CapG n=2 Tax=Domibacillus aminovorans TaxID=29332 RepID=A0A177L1F5_9BACI|nr:hypothetical protein AWH49_04680 [Domibacillus aminovorans]
MFYKEAKIKKAKKEGLIVGEKTRILGIPHFGSEPYLIRIGKRCTITSGVKFITHDGGTWVFREWSEYKDVKKYGKIQIGDNCFIGVNSIIMPNVVIGDNSIIGAGSIVTKSFPNNSVVAGVPAKFIMSLEEYMEKSKLHATPIKINGPAKKQKLIEIFWGE